MLCRAINVVHLFCLIGLICVSSNLAHSNEPMVIKHYDKGYSPLLRVYLRDVLGLVLEKTVAEYGPYKLQFYSRHLSTNRSKLETERGVLIDIHFNSNWRGNFVNPGRVIEIEYPVFDGVLGLRNLIIKEQNRKKFSSVRGLRDLQGLLAGQGANWEDVDVLEANGLPVIQSQLFDSLFPMLAKNRFDYLPLGILEVENTLQSKLVEFPGLEIEREIAIFYPLPFYLYVNRQRPELAARFADGLLAAQQDGSLEQLFNRHFGYVQPELYNNAKKIIILNSPLLTEDKNREFIQAFLNKYRPQSYVLPGDR